MVVDKPTKPTETLPSSFGGTKNIWDNDRLTNGFPVPPTTAILSGDNFNYDRDVSYKYATFNTAVSDGVQQLGTNELLTVNSSSQYAVVPDGTQGQVLTRGATGLEWSTSTAGLPTGFMQGLVPSNGTDTEHDIVFGVGKARSSDDTEDIVLTSALTKQIDVNWAAGNNQGGFPSGLTLSANTWYHLFDIYNPTSQTADAGFDSSLTAANLLADATGFTKYRRVGAVLTDGSGNIINGQWDEMNGGAVKFTFDTMILATNQTFGTSATLVTMNTPTGLKTKVRLGFLHATFAPSAISILITNGNQSDTAPAAGNRTLVVATNIAQNIEIERTTNELSQIRVRATGTTASAEVTTIGYIDERIA